MKKILEQVFLESLRVFSILTFFSSFSVAEDRAPSVSPAVKEIIKLTDKGIEPKVTKIAQTDPSVFFLNTTTESLATLAINFGGRRSHCASGNLTMSSDGILKSSKPIPPKDFALTCFPEKGTYDVVVKGLKSSPEGAKGQVIIQ